jgi:septal ring factor EnvC (AmiA/AmiB activator)
LSLFYSNKAFNAVASLSLRRPDKTKLSSGGQKAVLIQHGNYISVYKNLDTVIVTKGQTGETKQNIGSVHTDSSTGKTILAFVLYKEVKTVNPTFWLYKM